MIDKKLYQAYRFFHEHGYQIQGEQAKAAIALARAEVWAEGTEGVELCVMPEEESYHDVYGQDPPEASSFSCLSIKIDGEVMASMGFVDDDAAYQRVVFAELALEAMNG